jgi:putative phosphoribosyl transferase
MGAVVDGATPIIARNEAVIDAVNIDEATFKAVCEAELFEIERRR